MPSPSAIQGVHTHISHFFFAIQSGNGSVVSVIQTNSDKDNTTATKNYSNICDRFSYFLFTLFLNLQGVAFVHCTELGAMKLDAALFPLIFGIHEDILSIIKALLFLIYKLIRVLCLQTHFENWGFFNALRLFWGMEINTANTANFLSNRLTVLLKWNFSTWGIPLSIFHLLSFSLNKWDWCSSISLPGCFRVSGEEGKDRRRCSIK